MSAPVPDDPKDAPDGAAWRQRWREGRIGFHRDAPNPWLVAAIDRLAPRGDERILVPLCGKSVDLAWLERRGHSVVGVELAEQAIRAFLQEQGRTAREESVGPFRRFTTGRLELWCGDFFAFDAARAGTIDAIWDRAALIALPPALRRVYAPHLLELLRPGGRLLLVTLEREPATADGPPFSVNADEVAALFSAAQSRTEVAVRSLLDDEPRWREQGCTVARERVVEIVRRR